MIKRVDNLIKVRHIYVYILLFLTINICNAQEEVFTKADTLRGELSELRSCYDVLSYHLDVTVDIENHFISGSNQIYFNAVNNFNRMQIDLFANMNIEKILFNEKELSYAREFNAVFIQFPETIKKASKQSIVIYYSGKPIAAKKAPWDGGFIWKKDTDENPWIGVACQEKGASSWWPCKDHQSDEPKNMDIKITIPSNLVAVSNGRLLKKTVLNKHQTQYHWHVSYPINNYNVTLNIGKFSHVSDVYVNPNFKDTLTLDYYVLPQNVDTALKHFKQVKPMMDCYYRLFGEYPFVKDGYKLVETPYLGMEHQSCISYGNKFKNGYLGRDLSGTGYVFDYIIIHETAHEWWGNKITTNDIADMWIHEGFGTYAEALYVECLYGYEAYLKYINSEKKGVNNDAPIIGKYNLNNKGSGDMYPKGALLIHTIRSIMNNDKLFFETLYAMQDSFAYKTINSSDVELLFSKKAEKDLSGIFDTYLRSDSIPLLEINVTPDSNNLKIEYRFASDAKSEFKKTNHQKSFSMPVKVTFKTDDYQFIHPTTLWKTMTIYNMKPEDFKIAEDLFYLNANVKYTK